MLSGEPRVVMLRTNGLRVQSKCVGQKVRFAEARGVRRH